MPPESNPPSAPVPESSEHVLYRGSPSLWLHTGAVLLSLLAILGGAVLGVMFHVAFFGLAVIGVVTVLGVLLITRATFYEVTSERLRVSRGLLNRRTDELELYRVKDATLVEPFPWRLFGLGRIEIATVDESTPKILLDGIHNPKVVREALRQSTEACRAKKRVRMTELE